MSILEPIVNAVLPAGIRLISRLSLPQTAGSLKLNGLKGSAEVLRDRWGIAHIFADHLEDALFAQGFTHAQERLWQMDFNRRVCAGRLSEVLGEAGLQADIAMRTLGMYAVAQREADMAADEFQPLLETYCAGVNAWIEKGKLPVEFSLLGYRPEPWQKADILAWVKLMCWTLSVNWESELLRGQLQAQMGAMQAAGLEVDLTQNWPFILDAAKAGSALASAARTWAGPGAFNGVGSNNWVIGAARSASGKPILANDMHLSLTNPAIWYLNTLCAAGVTLAGASLPGVPLVVAGHNGEVAWGYTNGFTDVQDLYEEHLRRADGRVEYEFRGEWLPAEVRREEIRVKGKPPVVEEVVVTHHGPVINRALLQSIAPEPPYALRWTALEPDHTIETFFAGLRARTCLEMREAMRRWGCPIQNVVLADRQGNIAYLLPGNVPVRAKGNGSLPSPGWTGEFEWVGTIPFDELPFLHNPPRGFIVTANNAVNGPEYPHFLSIDYINGSRAGRITELIEAAEQVDTAYVRRMQSDLVSLSARQLAHYTGKLRTDDARPAAAVCLMAEWDGRLDADSPAAALYEVLLRKVLELLLARTGSLSERVRGAGLFPGLWPEHNLDWLGVLLQSPDSAWWNLGGAEDRDEVLLLALGQSLDWLSQELGADMQAWRWGALHQLTFGHVLGAQKPLDRVFNLGPFPISGDGTTVCASWSNMGSFKHDNITGPPFRFIIDLADPGHALSQVAPGQSGHPASAHFADGISDWFNNVYHPLLLDRAEIETVLEARLQLIAKA